MTIPEGPHLVAGAVSADVKRLALESEQGLVSREVTAEAFWQLNEWLLAALPESDELRLPIPKITDEDQ